jgi:hypothetical protein
VSASTTLHCGSEPPFSNIVLDDPIILGEDEPNTSEADIDCDSLRVESAEPNAGVFDRPKPASDSRILAPPSSPRGCYDSEPHDFNETAQLLRPAKQGALTSDSMRRYGPSSRGSSEPLHCRIDREGFYTSCTRSEAATSCASRPHSQPPRCSQASPLDQLSPEDHLHTDRSAADEHELVCLALDTDTFDEEKRREQQEEDEERWDDYGEGQLQHGVNVAAVRTAKSGDDIPLSSKEGEGARPPKRQRPVPNRDPPPEPGQDERWSLTVNYSDGELNNTEFDEDNSPRPAKRQKLSPSCAQKRKHHLQQRSSGHLRPRRKPQRRSRKLHSPLDKETEVAMGPICLQSGMSTPSSLPETQHQEHQIRRGGDQSSATSVDGRVASTARTAPVAPESAPLTDPALPPQVVDADPDWEVRDILGKKVVDGKVHYLVDWRLTLVLESELGNAKELVDEFEARLRTQRESQHGRAVKVGTIASQDSERSSDDDSGLSDSDLSSDEERYSSDKAGRSSTRMHSPWSALDEQRLLGYKKENKPWSWIFRKFPNRTPPAVRTRWNMIQEKAE